MKKTTKSLLISGSLCLMTSLFSCAPELKNEGIKQAKENQSFCYQYSSADVTEKIQLQINGDSIKGYGQRGSLYNVGYRENLTFQGVFNDGNARVEVQIQPENNAAYNSTETWLIEDQKLTIQSRENKLSNGTAVFHAINCPGSQTEGLYDEIQAFSEGYAVALKNNLYGLINEKKEVVIDFKYLYLGCVHEGTIDFIPNGDNVFQGLMTVEEEVIFEAKYDDIHPYDQGLAAFKDKGKWGFYDKNKQIVIAPQYDEIEVFNMMPQRHPFSEGLARVRKDNKYGFINPKNKMVIPLDYSYAKRFENGLAEVVYKNQWIKIDKTGKCVENCDEVN